MPFRKDARHGRELVAQITAMARRTSSVDDTQNEIEYEPFVIDLVNHEVKRDDAKIDVR
jgi:DNA-binding response OmpR family regulator